MASMYGKVMVNRFNKALVLIRQQARNENWCRNTIEAINRIEAIMEEDGLQEAYEYVISMTREVTNNTPNQAELTAMFWNVYWSMYLAQFNVNKFNRIWRQLSVDL